MSFRTWCWCNVLDVRERLVTAEEQIQRRRIVRERQAAKERAYEEVERKVR